MNLAGGRRGPVSRYKLWTQEPELGRISNFQQLERCESLAGKVAVYHVI